MTVGLPASCLTRYLALSATSCNEPEDVGSPAGALSRRLNRVNELYQEAYRFWLNVVLDPSGCWLWTGTTDHGYGVFRCDGKPVRANRWSLARAIGRELKPGELACHSCDVRACVRPSHLFVGSIADNIQDATAKGRMAHGARNIRTREPRRGLPRSATPDVLVATIRRRLSEGAVGGQLAREYGLDPSTVSRIRNGSRRAVA